MKTLLGIKNHTQEMPVSLRADINCPIISQLFRQSISTFSR
mgnify:FL=1